MNLSIDPGWTKLRSARVDPYNHELTVEADRLDETKWSLNNDLQGLSHRFQLNSNNTLVPRSLSNNNRSREQSALLQTSRETELLLYPSNGDNNVILLLLIQMLLLPSVSTMMAPRTLKPLVPKWPEKGVS
jgi:hypothetical protein